MCGSVVVVGVYVCVCVCVCVYVSVNKFSCERPWMLCRRYGQVPWVLGTARLWNHFQKSSNFRWWLVLEIATVTVALQTPTLAVFCECHGSRSRF